MTITLVATGDPDDRIRKGRLAWVAASLKLPQQMAWQAIDKSRRITPRNNEEGER